MRILVVEAGKAPYVQEIDKTLESMQKVVGGSIEIFQLPPELKGSVVVLNEEGRLNGSCPNRVLRNVSSKVIDVIFGTFFVCDQSLDSITDNQIEAASQYFANLEKFFVVN